MSMFAPSKSRVSAQTDSSINRQIMKEIEQNLEYFRSHPDQIDTRLRELDEEWDVERVLELNSSALSLLGLFMGFASSKKWFLLPIAVQSFFLQHAVQGWCPPLPILRSQGFRTSEEINYERYGLKLLRGDLDVDIEPSEGAERNSTGELLDAITH